MSQVANGSMNRTRRWRTRASTRCVRTYVDGQQRPASNRGSILKRVEWWIWTDAKQDPVGTNDCWLRRS